MPRFLSSPSHTVAENLARAHDPRLEVPGKNGTAHRYHDIRHMVPIRPFAVDGHPDGWMEKYRNTWQQIASSS